MEISDSITTSQHAVSSQDGLYIAALNGERLEIRAAASLGLVRSISTSSKGPILRWSPVFPASEPSSRLLLADDQTVRVWDLHNERWTATINNGSGGMGNIVNVEFGRTKDDVVCFSDFGSKVTVWSLKTGRSVEVRDPKFPNTRTFGFRPTTGLCALLSRPGPHDVLTLHAPSSYAVLKMLTLQSVDAQGMRWSPDGRWLAVWDTPSIGYRVYIYTADGHLYRVYNGHCEEDRLSLGVKSIEWSPRSDHLAIGGHDRRVTLLSTRTFSPVMFLDHTATIQLAAEAEVWQEHLSPSLQRSYNTVSQPVAPPIAPVTPADQAVKTGLSILSSNADGTMVATRDDSAPTTVWLWDLTKLAASAVLIQHSPIKKLLWHPTLPSILLIQCSHDEPTIYLYNTISAVPYPVILPMRKSTGSKFEAKWLQTTSTQKPSLVFSDSHNFLLAWPEGRNPMDEVNEQGEKNDLMDHSEDSLYDILSGKKPAPYMAIDDTEALVSELEGETTDMLDDTFAGRRGVSVDSMDECF
ncbi:WD40 repeat-like protein [Venturia nashicola]|uniref:WD40 repeat-like protein n=1 Tax=Venturia nashicola TaxID=86259 RepID=A0A4Z1NXA7_9PEZI|nr:WD40 repeat-like protein [Venturia nashicola]